MLGSWRSGCTEIAGIAPRSGKSRGENVSSRKHGIATRALLMSTGALMVALLIGTPGIASARTMAPKQLTHFTPTTHNYNAPQIPALLTYGGAKVQVTNTNYVIMWEPPKLQDGTPATVSAPYNSLMQRYFNDVGGNGLYNNNTQYYEIVHGKNKPIKNQSTLGGFVVDTSAYPTGQCNDSGYTGTNCVTDLNMQAEVTKIRNQMGWKATSKDMFFVMTAKGEGSCASNLGIGCSFSSWCGYHWFVGKEMYANIPYTNTFTDCTTRSSFPNDPDADVTLSVVSHEQMEAVTDGYYPNGWNSNQGEIGDLCAYNYGSVGLDGGKANQQWNGDFYILQQEYSNKHAGCVQSGP
jgi:hypothetical protein